MGVTLAVPADPGHRVGDTATVVARPESISVGTGQLPATIKDSTFLGSYVEYELELGPGQDNMLAVDAEWMSRGLHAPGEVIEWELLPERAFVLPPPSDAGRSA